MSVKRFFALILAVLMLVAVLPGCQNGGGNETTQPEATQSPEEAKVLKVLTLGHSLAQDSGHMLALVAAAEGYESLMVGTLYHSGCSLAQHVDFATNDKVEYELYISSTDKPNVPPKQMKDMTMRNALIFDYWDIIIMQGGVFEIAKDEDYKNGNIQTIQKYVNDNKLNPTAIFAWHMTWVPPTDNTLRDMYPYENNSYYTKYKDFNDDRTTMYQTVTKCVQDNILTDSTFQFVIPSGTVMENALSSYLEETDIHRDYVHASDFSRIMISYVWYCKLAGVDHLDEIKLDSIPKSFLKAKDAMGDKVLTDAEKAIILEAVNNALANPFQMTQSQYTEAPAQ